jgi:ubiquinone/menaquinone biosynthesis C-methylase UbiE
MKEKHCCPWWMAYFFDNPLRRLYQKPEVTLGPYLKEGMSALDFGCGMGYWSIKMAEMVGPTGKIYSFDIQQKMLDIMNKRAAKKGVADRIERILVDDTVISLEEKVDIAVTIWVVHEVPDPQKLFDQIARALKEGGKLLFAEPSGHIKKPFFEDEIKMAEKSGLMLIDRPKVGGSMAALLEKNL